MTTSEARHLSHEDWDEARKSALVTEIVDEKLSMQDACERHGLEVDVVLSWLRLFRRSALSAFDERLKQTLIRQGVSAKALHTAEFTGTLDDISVADLIQTLQIAGKDAVISVSSEGLNGRIWCAAGAITDAEAGPLRAEAALYRILSLERGLVVAELHAAPHVRTIRGSTVGLLLEASHRKDEAARLWSALGDANRRYRVADQALQSTRSPAELSLLGLFDGERSLREVFRASELGDLETLKLLKQLIYCEYVLELDPTQIEPERELPSVARLFESSGASYVSLATTQSSARVRTPRSLWGALGGVGLVLGMLWLFGRAKDAATSGAASSMEMETPSATRSEPAPTYAVDVRVEPSHARLQLDRQGPSTGRLSTVLPRDGATHELRIVADGYATTLLLFLDTAPPSNIRLEALPAFAEAQPAFAEAQPAASATTLPAPTSAPPPALPPSPSELEPVAPSAPAQSAAAAAPRRRSRAASRGREAPARDVARPTLPASVASDERPQPGPQVQIIGGDTPKIQIID
jgi:transposase-like protein